MSIRNERVASLLKEELGAILLKDYNDPSYGFITVTDVRVTQDLRIAKVYFSVFGAPEVRARAMAMLESERPQLRSLLAGRVRMRFMPSLEFFLDDTMERVDRINSLLRKINDERTTPPDDPAE
jgi:ribosome-binding factor A